MSNTLSDELYMRRALELAEKGRYTARPNPKVGCVLVRENTIIGEGWHIRAGTPHAEINALYQAGSLAHGSTAYVTLEPCAHHGKTPPCCDALINAGVNRVVIASEDPYPQVNGKGIECLRKAGINVEVGLMRKEAEELNCGFLSRVRRGRPWVRAKIGMSLDGRTALADGRSKWITSAKSREDVHQWRLSSCAILTGIGTVLADNPQLTARTSHDTGLAPLRVILDSQLRIPLEANVLDKIAPTLIVHRSEAEEIKLPSHINRMSIDTCNNQINLKKVLEDLGNRGINDVFVEAGSVLTGSLLKKGLIDELLVYISPRLLGDQARPMIANVYPESLELSPYFKLVEIVQIDTDIRLRFLPIS
ncbi:bifunctional diaminohydroxyphosphoribosylaminopyrimidine deaminase/5-amino-6-(5-phosphoribosylamino)uracil reductase RibD [Xenorhabdus anantnagensis]|uniref:Riboflavin biosynthesis protein RibD n=1 Tax=Xenorhabdus anantnagensis TaxID=3025875 RepID=A0ABT5LMU8_9GAMM|nr:bifunctional diaminohydroxyphosphoribosylaminopyrimidine deaminase/5-amino-6-(5-phosphoribosylamino)uracil reductase RibD [Xenorhabdus anantnagensis]MDC9595738.1 bifunctional diaminohydroxyphosphoribosylaminopyrimidine deaminase/5-amino-6-(5-phosphoribosylamino)uracil reductase RibD [Xenorhabdus anantnagensis]